MFKLTNYTLRDISTSRSEEKIKIDNLDIWVRYVVRPLSYLVSYPFIKFGISANTASYISFLISILGLFVVVGWPQKMGVLIAAIIFNFWIIFDAVDGNIARTTGSTSETGNYIDAIAGYFYLMVLYVSLGYASFKLSNNIMNLYVGMLGSLSTIFPRLVLQKKNALFGVDDSDEFSKNNYGLTQIIALNIAGPAGIMNPIMVIAVVFGFLESYLVFSVGIQFLLGIYTIVSTFKKIYKR